jgi:hypothetical protein
LPKFAREATATPIQKASRTLQEGFYCLLDEQPSHLVPERLLRQSRTNLGEEGFRFNPDCRLVSNRNSDLSADVARLITRSAPDGGCIAWVRDRLSGTDMPFWLGPELSRIAHRLQHEPESIAGLPAQLLAVLCSAQVLVSTEHANFRRKNWSTAVQQCQAGFRQSGYVPITGLIHPFHLAALRRHYRRQIRKGAIRFGDDQSARRYIAHNEPAARFFHLQLSKIISMLVGEPVKPSYVYMAAYQPGARLEKHTDREQCAFSITLCVDYSPEPSLATPWPLHLDTPRGTVSVYQALGDGLLYRGCELPHYRGTLAEGHTSTSIFFHYVAGNFAGPLE